MRAQTAPDHQALERAITNSLVDFVEHARVRGEFDAALDVAAQLEDHESQLRGWPLAGRPTVDPGEGGPP